MDDAVASHTRSHDAGDVIHEEREPASAAGFKTPPRPARVILPPTPPESSPASTTSSAGEQPAADVTARTPARSPSRRSPARRSTATLAAPRRDRKTLPRSRSPSPAVVSSTTADDVPPSASAANDEHVMRNDADAVAPSAVSTADDADAEWKKANEGQL